MSYRRMMMAVLVLSIWLSGCWVTVPPTPPSQPKSGPGGRDYKHAKVTVSPHGEGGAQYWLFEPADPKPAEAPLIVFLHGWLAMEPPAYRAWIDHLVQRGNVVVYPRYQARQSTPFDQFQPNAIAAVRSALAELRASEDHVAVREDLTAFVGHSMGGMLTMNLAAVAADEGLPRPKALLSVEPWEPKVHGMPESLLEDHSRIPAGTLLICLAGEEDSVVGDSAAKRYFYDTVQIPLSDKDYVLLRSDDRGQPALQADHFAPAAPPADFYAGPLGGFYLPTSGFHPLVTNALDYYGIWKVFDILTDTAFGGAERASALNGSEQQRSMGLWSDGVPVRELLITDSP